MTLRVHRGSAHTEVMKVFLRYYVELPFPAERINDVIGKLPGEWLDVAASEANLRGLLMLGTPAGDSEPDFTAADLCVSISAAEVEGRLMRRALEWLALRGDTPQPILQGDLELAELGPCRTQLALSAQYRPFSGAPESPDRMEARRVGESTLKAFVDQLAAYIQTILGWIPASPINPPAHWPAPKPENRLPLGRGWLATS